MNTLWSWIVAPLAYGFMQRGMLAAMLVGVLCAIVGCYVVLRSMAFLGDALAHAVLPGVAVAYLMGANLLVGALAAAIVVALLISFFSRQGAIKEDTAIGIVFAAALALGVALISSVRTYAVDLTHIMFGNVLGVSPTDLWLIAGIGAVVLLTILAFYRQFLVVAFDPVLAATQRLPVEWLRLLLLLLIALTIVVSLQTVGVGLVAAMLVTPGAAAYLLTRRLPAMMAVAALIGAVSSISGLYLSYYINIASGAAVVLVATTIFTVVFLAAPGRGMVWRRGG
ncbi:MULTISPECIES: metal ABC transporter permease [Roseiflexus]|uniref:ABC-3 protein n=1 Tax=Roseiflexus castenholzii (strain DSM 13941 / HLO8) TaxID=383372 RepID=A7NJL2_ROSCS|nr:MULTISPECIES: metal ABC transporter permease [Roseiflexus]ABU57682.1 ABC-3 protein [Roseiflexus castenholzii DSM 13941]GIW00581.1 MAG: membrane protein [Roseiflexus sp.]